MSRAAAIWVGASLLALTSACSSAPVAVGGQPPPVVSTSTLVPSAAGTPLTPCADPAAAAARLIQETPPGPAVGAITGDRVTTSFALEGLFSAAPPPPGYVPTVAAASAACALESLYAPNGSAAAGGRLALAAVTIDAATRKDQTSVVGTVDFALSAGPPPEYQHRVAWILVTAANNDESAGCSTDPPSVAPATGVQADPYEVFALDAATGAGAVGFEDSYVLCSGNPPTPPIEWQPWQVSSVPWTLVSRAPDGLYADIEASWPNCEHYHLEGVTYAGSLPAAASPSTGRHVWADRDHPDTVRVLVDRVVGPDCGTAVPHRLTLHAATVAGRLPVDLKHAPLGVQPARP